MIAWHGAQLARAARDGYAEGGRGMVSITGTGTLATRGNTADWSGHSGDPATALHVALLTGQDTG